MNFDAIKYFTDMWAVGVICYVLLSGLSPFMGDTDIDTMTNVTMGKYNFDDDAFNQVSECAKDFIRLLLQKDGRCSFRTQFFFEAIVFLICFYFCFCFPNPANG